MTINSSAELVRQPYSTFPAELEDHLQCERIVDQGAFADIYLASRIVDRQLVAVKVLEPVSNPAILHPEVEAIERLSDHDHLVKFLDHGELSGNRHFIVMEYCPSNLGSELKRNSAPKYRDSAYVGIQVAAALESIHSDGILHGDVKPSNILRCLDGHIKLTDFSTFRFLESSEAVFSFSLGYAPPESLFGIGKADPSIDVYGLGATLINLIIGRPPYGADPYKQPLGSYVQQLHAGPWSDLATRFVPAQLKTLLAEMVHPSPTSRPSISAVRTELEDLVPYLGEQDRLAPEGDQRPPPSSPTTVPRPPGIPGIGPPPGAGLPAGGAAPFGAPSFDRPAPDTSALVQELGTPATDDDDAGHAWPVTAGVAAALAALSSAVVAVVGLIQIVTSPYTLLAIGGIGLAVVLILLLSRRTIQTGLFLTNENRVHTKQAWRFSPKIRLAALAIGVPMLSIFGTGAYLTLPGMASEAGQEESRPAPAGPLLSNPAPPNGFSSKVDTGGNVVIEWDQVEGVDEFMVRILGEEESTIDTPRKLSRVRYGGCRVADLYRSSGSSWGPHLATLAAVLHLRDLACKRHDGASQR